MKDELKYTIISSTYKGLQQYALYKSSGQLDSLCKSIYDSIAKSVELKASGLRVMSTMIHDASNSNSNGNSNSLKRILRSIRVYCLEENQCIVDTTENNMDEICLEDANTIIYSIGNDYNKHFNKEIVCSTVILGAVNAKNSDSDSEKLYFLTIYPLSPKEKMILNSDNSVKVIDSFLGGIA